MIKVSIIVPVYNSQKYLRRCLDSLINQTLKEIEIILVNDGSNDLSLDICYQYSKVDHRVQVINQCNKGVSAARNIGIDKAKGEYIGFVDSDDYIEEQMFEKMYNEIIRNDSDLCMCNFIIHKGSKQIHMNNIIKINSLYDEQILNDLISNIVSPNQINGKNSMTSFRGPVMYLYKKSIIIKNKIIFSEDLKIGEDFVFNLNYMKVISRVCIDSSYHYHYCINNSSTTRQYRENWWDEHKKLIKYIEEALDDCFEFYPILVKRVCIMKLSYYIGTIVNETKKNNSKKLYHKLKFINEVKKDNAIKRGFNLYDIKEDNLINKLFFLFLKFSPALLIYSVLNFKYNFLLKDRL